MTTVVAYARVGVIAMAADTCINVYERPIIGGAAKIVRFPAGRGEVLLGFAGAGGLPGVLAARLEVPSEPADDGDPQVWATSVARAITEVAVAAGLVDDGKLDATLILGWRGRLWSISHMVAVPHSDGVAAIGSGEGPAIGALDAFIVAAWPWSPVEMVAQACAIGIARDRYSAGPVDVHILPAPQAVADAVPAG